MSSRAQNVDHLKPKILFEMDYLDNVELKEEIAEQTAQQYQQQEKQDQMIHYSWRKLKDYVVVQGLNHIFAVDELDFDRWLSSRLLKK